MTRLALLLLVLNVACDPAATPPGPEPSQTEEPGETETAGESATPGAAETPSPAPTSEPEAPVAPEPTAEAETAAMPEPTAEAEAAAVPEPTAEAEAAAVPEPAAEAETVAVRAPTAEAEAAAVPEPPLTCEAIEAEYSRLRSTNACSSDADCHIVSGQCAVGLGSCSHAVSVSVTQEALTTLGRAYSDAGCTGPVCRCARPPDSAHCDSGSCQPGERRADAPVPEPEAPTGPRRPTECPALACALPEMGPGEPICTRRALDENGCPTCRCAD